jgi:hypothetical protein
VFLFSSLANPPFVGHLFSFLISPKQTHERKLGLEGDREIVLELRGSEATEGEYFAKQGFPSFFSIPA